MGYLAIPTTSDRIMVDYQSCQDYKKKIIKDIPAVLVIVLFSLIVSMTVNFLSPKGIALKGQWDRTKGVVFARGKAQNILPELEIKNPLKVKKIVEDSSMFIVDVRSRFIYNDGHIPGALSYPLVDFDHTLEKFCSQFDKTSPLLIYCSGRSCTDSHTAASRLKAIGFSRIKVFTGGFQEWQEMGFRIQVSKD